MNMNISDNDDDLALELLCVTPDYRFYDPDAGYDEPKSAEPSEPTASTEPSEPVDSADSADSIGDGCPYLERAKECYELKELERLGLAPTLDHRALIWAYITRLFKENIDAKLIPVADEKSMFLRHFCDSIQPLLLFGFKRGATIVDIGSSGGFPAVPIRIMRPDLSFVIVEPNREKAAFLEGVKGELGFKNMHIHLCKAEDFVPLKKADYVVSRGITALAKVAKLSRPLLNKGGRMYVYKTKAFPAEMEAMTDNKDKDGVRICEIARYNLSGVSESGLSLVSMEFI